jgi:branched-chain amino acid transport system substrate-binding protein
MTAIFLIGCTSKAPLEEVTVGHIASFSGPDRALGERSRQAVSLAVEEFNAGIDSSVERRIAVLHADSADRDMGPVAVRLVTVNGAVALLGGSTAAEIESLAGVARSYTVPVVAPGSWESPAGEAYVFPTGLSPTYRGQIMPRFAVQELKVKRAAVLTNAYDKRPAPDRAQSQAIAAALARSFRQYSGTVMVEQTYKNTEELKVLAQRLLHERTGVLFVAGIPDDVLTVRAAGLDEKTPLSFVGPDAKAGDLRSNALANGVYLATAFTAGATPRAQEFARNYKERFGETPDETAALAYDSARILFEAIRRAKSADGSHLRQDLSEIKTFDSLTGPLAWAAGNQASRAGFIVRIDQGHVQQLKRYDPEPASTDDRSAAASLAWRFVTLYAAVRN